jgi:FecR protein
MGSSTRLLFGALLGLLALSGPSMAATPIGQVAAVVGSPTGSGRALSAGSPIFENDRLVTGAGNVQIIFVDDTHLVVGPNSTLVIDRFLMRGGNRAQKFSIDALRGTFRFITGNSAKGAYDIQTANATIGVRGTAFDFSSQGETLIAVLEGGVRLCSAGRCESIPQGCGVGRASSNGVQQLGGRSKGRALGRLPYIVQQGSLSRGFRLNTQSCRASLSLVPATPNGTKGPHGPAGGPPGGSGPPGDGGPPGGDGFGGGRPGGGPEHNID